MRRRTAHVLTATALTAVAFAGPVAGAVAAADLGMPGFVAGDFAPLEVWPKSAVAGATVTVNTTACGPGSSADGDATTVGAAVSSWSRAPTRKSSWGSSRSPATTHPAPMTSG